MMSLYVRYGAITYWAMLLVINAALLHSILPVKNTYSYIFLGLSLLFSLVLVAKNPKFLSERAFGALWIITFLNLLYFVLFDQSANGLLYLIAKTATFLMIAVNVYYGYDFLVANFARLVVRIGTVALIAGVVLNTHYFGGRYTGPFGNPNSLGWLAALLFGTVYLDESGKSRQKYLLLLFFLAMVLMSGSRSSLGGVFLAILLKGGLSFKRIAIVVSALALLLAFQNVAESFGVKTGLDRIIKSEKKKNLLSGRSTEYALGIATIWESPVTGHGLDKYAYISKRIVRLSGLLRKDPNFVGNPHNSFIALFVMYGIPFGGVVLLTLLYYIGKILILRVQRRDLVFMVLFSFAAAMFESYLFGVSGFEGLIFWIALPLTLMYARYGDPSPEEEETQTKGQAVANSNS